MRFRYDKSRPKFDVVTAVEIGDLDRGYRAIDITGKHERICSLTCLLYQDLRRLPVKTKGELPTVAVDARAAEVRAIKLG